MAEERSHIAQELLRPSHFDSRVKPDNIHELIMLPDVDGALVGGASLDTRVFRDIVARSRQSAV